MYGSDMGSLNIYLNALNTRTLVWTQNGNKFNKWYNGQVSVTSARSFRIEIEAVRGKGVLSDIAIDDLDFIERSCPILPQNALPQNQTTTPIITTTTKSLRPVSTFDCTFESGFCMWKSTNDSTFKWQRGQGISLTSSSNSGPLDKDHTLGTSDGYYLFAPLNSRNLNDVARLESDQLSGPRCMEFYYYFNSNAKYQFNIYMKLENQIGVPVFTRENTNANYWRVGRVSVPTGPAFKVLIELKNVQYGTVRDIISLDDVFFSIDSGSCKDSSDINKLCTFADETACNYTFTSTSNDFKWNLYLPPQQNAQLKGDSLPPLPINDHTTDGIGTGYVYALSKQGMLVNSSASLTSKIYQPFLTNKNESTRCLEFYYFIQNNNALILNVKGRTYSSLSNIITNLLWSRDFDHSGFWWKGEVNVKYLTNYSFVFEAIVGKMPENNGLIGLDDISLKNGQCSNLIDTCDFERKDFCNWINVNENGKDDFDWKLISGQTNTPFTGPRYSFLFI
jgi:hypothetical protein